MDTNRVPQPRHDDDSVERTTPASSAPTPAWTTGCSLAALSSPSTTLMARSSSTSACPAAAARIADSPASIAHATYIGGPRPSGPGYAEFRLYGGLRLVCKCSGGERVREAEEKACDD